jgi:hypothetical protein
MTDWTNFAGFTGLAVVAACWRQVLAFIQRIRSFFIVKATIRGDAARAVTAYCFTHFKRSPFGDRWFQSSTAHVRPLNRMQEVCCEKPPQQPLIFFNGWKPMMLGGVSHQNSPYTEEGMACITVIRGLMDMDTLMIEALREHNEMQAKSKNGYRRYRVRRVQGYGARSKRGEYSNAPQAISAESPGGHHSEIRPTDRILGWNPDDIGPPVADSPLASLALPPALDGAVEEFRRWKQSEKWFRERLVPWRRGWLLFGKPGTGKTSFVRALAQLEDLPVWSYDLASLSNEEMVSNWREMQESAPCIALFEDIDAVFDGRSNVHGEQGGGLTFDCFLNCLGGIETADGVFVMVTTNHPEKLDPALGIPGNGVSSRPGRLDRAIELPSLAREQREQIAKRICGDWPETIPALLDKSDGYTGAQFTEICVSEAQARYWGEKRS